MSDFMSTPLENVPYWLQPILPLVYREAMSYNEQLKCVIKELNRVIDNTNSMAVAVQGNTTDITKLKEICQELNNALTTLDDYIRSGDAADIYINSLASWIDANLKDLVGRVVKYVFFGLTDDGKFVAYIPDTWDFISFDTVMDIKSDMYGHLLLRW